MKNDLFLQNSISITNRTLNCLVTEGNFLYLREIICEKTTANMFGGERQNASSLRLGTRQECLFTNVFNIIMGSPQCSKSKTKGIQGMEDGGICRYTWPPRTTKRRTATNLKTKNDQNCQKIKLYGSLATKKLKEETFIQTGRRGGEG